MTDAPETVAPKRRGGWPKGKPRVAPDHEKVKAAADRAELPPLSTMMKMKSRPNWESDDFIGAGQEGTDRLHIPDEITLALARDGVALQWVTRSVRGQETPQEMSKMTRGGWTPVHQSDFDGVLDGLFMPKGHDEMIAVEDCLLVARPMEIHQKAKAMERKESRRPLQIAEEQLGHGIPGVTGSTHKTVNNTIKKTMERVEIPE